MEYPALEDVLVNVRLLSVVIPCLNGAHVLGRQLSALADQEYAGDWEVVVADNGSSDGSTELAKSFERRIASLTVVDASARRGQAYARNVGAEAAAGDALLFVDADDAVAPGYLAAMAEALSQHDFVAAHGDGESLNPDWVRGTRRLDRHADGLPNSFDFLPFSGGGLIGIRRDAFERVGGFDADHWRSGQDIDFCWRVQLAGVELHPAPGATVHIAYRATLRSQYRQGRHYGRGEVFLYRKFRAAGMPGPTWKQTLWRWYQLARRLVRVRTKADLGKWLRDAGRSMGRLQGSAHHRVMYL
jgi:glycosyltransferase involved in cell wall biosynthesis